MKGAQTLFHQGEKDVCHVYADHEAMPMDGPRSNAFERRMNRVESARPP